MKGKKKRNSRDEKWKIEYIIIDEKKKERKRKIFPRYKEVNNGDFSLHISTN